MCLTKVVIPAVSSCLAACLSSLVALVRDAFAGLHGDDGHAHGPREDLLRQGQHCHAPTPRRLTQLTQLNVQRITYNQNQGSVDLPRLS